MAILVESLMLFMHVLYLIMATQSDRMDEVNLAYVMIWIIIIL